MNDTGERYTCFHEDSPAIGRERAEALGLRFPDAYLYRGQIVRLSRAIKARDQSPFCVLPFCHTLEGEALGADVHYGDAASVPRPAVGGSMETGSDGPRRKTAEEVLRLPPLNCSSGRMNQVLDACRVLSEEGEAVMFNLNGPLTILNVLMETMDVFHLLMEGPQLRAQIYEKLRADLLLCLGKAAASGVDVISYGDAMSATDIIGPKMAAEVTREFTLPFLSEAAQLLEKKSAGEAAPKKTVILLCPKTAQPLRAEKSSHWGWTPLDLPEPMTYSQAFSRASAQHRRILSGCCVKHMLLGDPFSSGLSALQFYC